MISDRWEDDVFSELERLGTLAERVDAAGDRQQTPELRIMLEGDGHSARVMDNRTRAFVVRLPADRVLPALRLLSPGAGAEAAIRELIRVAQSVL